MPTTSERAIAARNGPSDGPRDFPVDPLNVDHMRETWRVMAEKLAECEAKLDDMKHRRTVLRDELVLACMDQGIAKAKADMIANTSKTYTDFLDKLKDATAYTKKLAVNVEAAHMLYWRANNREANERSERRMSR